MAPNPLDGRAARLKALFLSSLTAIDPNGKPDAKTLAEIDPKIDIAAQAIVDAFDILMGKK